MVQQGDTVHVHLEIATDGSGHSLYGEHGTMEAQVVQPPSETHWGKYHLLVPMSVLTEELGMDEDEIRDALALREEDVGEGYFVAAGEGYVEE